MTKDHSYCGSMTPTPLLTALKAPKDGSSKCRSRNYQQGRQRSRVHHKYTIGTGNDSQARRGSDALQKDKGGNKVDDAAFREVPHKA